MTAKTSEVAVTVVELPGMDEYLAQNARPIAKLEKLADELIESMNASVKSFFALCEAARELDKKAVRHVLREKGLDESRVSEILRVAHSTPEIWEQYKAKAIGFKLALKKAREADGAGREGRTVSERKRFVEELRRVFEEYLPVSGEPPAYFDPTTPEKGQIVGDYTDGCGVALPEVRVHGRKLALKGLLYKPARAK